MEFMDRRKRSILVQFWLTVESFKNPLESVDSDSEEDEDEPIQEASGSDTIKGDICMIHDLYFSGSIPHDALSCISKKHSDIISSFAKDELTPLPATERKVRRSVMLAQRQVEREMEQDFEDFERSQLWFKVLGDTELKYRKSEPAAHGIGKHRKSPSADSLPTSQSSSVLLPKPQHALQFSPRAEFSPNPSFVRPRTTSDNSSQASLGSGGQLASIPTRTAPSNIELLMSPPLESTRAPLFDDPEDKFPTADEEQLQRMEAIQAALNDIIALEKETDRPPTPERGVNLRLPGSRDGGRRRVIFDDDNDVDADGPSKDDQPDEGNESGRGSFQLAVPGDLQLSYEIARITEKISSLRVQDSILDSLIKKAELTGDAQELRLLKKSKSSMGRDLRNLEFQKLQYEQQEIANRLVPERTEVSIASSAVGEEDGKSVVRYLVEVKQLGSDGSFSSGWVVARRYNEFLKMHNQLKERYALVRNLDFPGKRLMTALSMSFVDSRRIALEKYLQVRLSLYTNRRFR
jgi:sorting nexin-25